MIGAEILMEKKSAPSLSRMYVGMVSGLSSKNVKHRNNQNYQNFCISVACTTNMEAMVQHSTFSLSLLTFFTPGCSRRTQVSQIPPFETGNGEMVVDRVDIVGIPTDVVDGWQPIQHGREDTRPPGEDQRPDCRAE